MKPLKLSLQAFGPFAGQETVDFTSLGENPLFLINGPTGAGKSSILDAICYALYGHTTGAERDATQMRCDHADVSVLTEVSLEFMLGDKRYLIRRVPLQERAKSRGEGTTTQQPEAQLRELDGSEDGRLMVSKSVSEATTHIKDLLGLDVEQFRQVMVLPQGKFRELLMADSREREKIFGQLFQTNIYRRIEDRLKAQAAGIKQQVEGHRSEIKGILQTVEVSSENEVAAALEALKPQLADALAAKQAANQTQQTAIANRDQGLALQKRFSDYGAKREALNTIQAQLPQIEKDQLRLQNALNAQKIQHHFDQQQSQASHLSQLEQEITLSKQQSEKASADLELATAALSQAQTALNGLDELKKQQNDLQRYEGQLTQLTQAESSLQARQKTAEASRLQYEVQQREYQALLTEQTATQTSTHQLTIELETLPGLEAKVADLSHKLKLRQELESLRQEAAQIAEQIRQAQTAFDSQTAEHSQAQRIANQTEFQWHSGQAALLAKELQPGEPCPVCGSAEHPKPASLQSGEELVTKEQVDAARSHQQQALNRLNTCKEALDQANTRKTLNTQHGQQLRASIADYADTPVELMVDELANAEAVVKQLQAKRIQQQQLNQRLSDIQQQLQRVSTSSTELEARVRQDHEGLAQVSAQVQQLRQQIPANYRQADVLTQELRRLSERIQTITQEAAAAQQQQEQRKSVKDKAESTLEALTKQSIDAQAKLQQARETWETALKASAFTDVTSFEAAILDEPEQQALREGVDRYQAEVSSLQAVLEQMQSELAEKKTPDMEALEADVSAASALFEQADLSWRELHERNNLFQSVQAKLKQAHQKNEALEQQYAVIGTLSDVANGQTGDKISLNRFVLSVLLDDVLIQASQRLRLMSKGRYQLVRKEDRAKGNKASGLELEVEDGNTGKTRSVATLSGGESFMAALSLALGLSDVVQSYAGGIKLDALFIDEGFGSLDTESLDAAIRVLIDLQQTGRMIGVISHVSELKEQMALRLDVVSNQSGSKISMKVA